MPAKLHRSSRQFYHESGEEVLASLLLKRLLTVLSTDSNAAKKADAALLVEKFAFVAIRYTICVKWNGVATKVYLCEAFCFDNAIKFYSWKDY